MYYFLLVKNILVNTQLQIFKGIRPCKQRLFFKGKQLENTVFLYHKATLPHYNIKEESTIRLIIKTGFVSCEGCC